MAVAVPQLQRAAADRGSAGVGVGAGEDQGVAAHHRQAHVAADGVVPDPVGKAACRGRSVDAQDRAGGESTGIGANQAADVAGRPARSAHAKQKRSAVADRERGSAAVAGQSPVVGGDERAAADDGAAGVGVGAGQCQYAVARLGQAAAAAADDA